ncbi:MAG: Ig-like domain-containing protein [Gammaproteobacteria bacterium]
MVTSITAVNDAPSFTKGPNPAVNEDAGAQSLPNWATALSAGPADEAGQTLSFQVTGNTNAALFSVLPAVSPTGTLTYTPAANANGSATISLVIKDNGGTVNGGVDTSAVQTFTITVNPVNDAPSFTKGPNQTVNINAGPQSIANWATALSKGPPNEASQTLSFQVTNNTNIALFSVAPALSPTGTLSYTSATNANGTATISLVIKDNGGTANGGVDTSAAQTFTLTVNGSAGNAIFQDSFE